ncbi:MAG: HEAT repeat domain-containing protein [Chloroflexota bacterium]
MNSHQTYTYKDLARFLVDENADLDLRREICLAFCDACPMLDKRRAVTPLLAALNSTDKPIQSTAARTLGRMCSLRAVSPLIHILADRDQTMELRMDAIDALWSISDDRAIPIFDQIIHDSDENVIVRSHALEWYFGKPDPIQVYIQLLSAPEPDIRFWAAYRLTQAFDDISPALSELDRVTATDHNLPIGFGWQINREAMQALETIYFRLITQAAPDENGEYHSRGSMYLISPAPEYSTVQWRYRKWNENWVYMNEPLPEIKLRIEPDWLADKLREKWPEIGLNIREPRPQAYVLDWHLQIDEKNMIGGLHRDQYGIVLTGDVELIYAFAEWYRGLFTDSQRLYLYQWADPHVELKPGVSAAEIEKAANRTSMSAVDVKAEDLSFG